MRQQVSNRLDLIDDYEPGTGSLDAFLYGEGDLDNGSFGLGIDYNHRWTGSLSGFLGGQAGYHYGDQSGLGFSVMAGVRGTF